MSAERLLAELRGGALTSAEQLSNVCGQLELVWNSVNEEPIEPNPRDWHTALVEHPLDDEHLRVVLDSLNWWLSGNAWARSTLVDVLNHPNVKHRGRAQGLLFGSWRGELISELKTGVALSAGEKVALEIEKRSGAAGFGLGVEAFAWVAEHLDSAPEHIKETFVLLASERDTARRWLEEEDLVECLAAAVQLA